MSKSASNQLTLQLLVRVCPVVKHAAVSWTYWLTSSCWSLSHTDTQINWLAQKLKDRDGFLYVCVESNKLPTWTKNIPLPFFKWVNKIKLSGLLLGTESHWMPIWRGCWSNYKGHMGNRVNNEQINAIMFVDCQVKEGTGNITPTVHKNL